MNSPPLAPDVTPYWFVAPSYVAETLGLIVRVNERIRKAVVFVGAEPNGFIPVGTGFLATVKYPDELHGPQKLNFMVTADHVLDLVQGDEVSIRLNRTGSGVSTIKVRKKHKVTHDDLVAICKYKYHSIMNYGL